MERLTSRNPHGRAIVKDFPAYEEYELVARLAAIEDILGDDYDLDRLRELAQADREGRCVVLPCKIGVFVYLIKRKLDGSDCVQKAEFWWSDIPEIGKTVFLTRKEAEAALEGMKNG